MGDVEEQQSEAQKIVDVEEQQSEAKKFVDVEEQHMRAKKWWLSKWSLNSAIFLVLVGITLSTLSRIVSETILEPVGIFVGAFGIFYGFLRCNRTYRKSLKITCVFEKDHWTPKSPILVYFRQSRRK